MKRTPVESSNIASIGFDAEHRLLEIEFKSGAVYQYENVPPGLAGILMEAPSKGKFFATHIKPTYKFEMVSGPAKAEESQHAG